MKATRAQVRTATALEDLEARLARLEEKLDEVLARMEAPKAAPRARTTKAAKDG